MHFSLQLYIFAQYLFIYPILLSTDDYHYTEYHSELNGFEFLM